MGRVLSAITSDDFVHAIVTSEREVNLQNVIARLHEAKDTLDFLALLFECGAFLHVIDQRVFDDLATAMEEVFDL
jgi:hypothetical protein